MPKLKNRACTENRAESGNTRKANGSSNDSSISRCVKELSSSKGGLFQSNSIDDELAVNQSPMQCRYNVFTQVTGHCQLFLKINDSHRHPGARWLDQTSGEKAAL